MKTIMDFWPIIFVLLIGVVGFIIIVIYFKIDYYLSNKRQKREWKIIEQEIEEERRRMEEEGDYDPLFWELLEYKITTIK